MEMLLGAVAIAFGATAVACLIGLALFPWFRSGERKQGHFRADQSTGGFRVDASKGLKKLTARSASSNELPLVGGVAIVIGIVAAATAAGLLAQLSLAQWTLLGVLLLAVVGYGLVGFVDDWMKVHRGVGISEAQKAAGVLVVSLAAGVAINRLVLPQPLSARLAYPPYKDIPGLGHLLVDAHFAWIAFFVLMTAVVASVTALAVDFADGMDGLCGGLMIPAALSFAAILLSDPGYKPLLPAAIAALAIAGASAGYLPFNWPSSWKARNLGWGKRRAKIIMGDTGSLAMGGLLALVAVVARLEFVLLFIGGVFVLEGLSALISARILVKFFRKFLFLERFGTSRGFAHTEFPLPFLATPMHHHYDLLNWDRKRLVYGAWALGAGLGLLGIASTIGQFTWERYLARFVAFLVIVAVWQAGPWTKSFFIGLSRPKGAPRESPRHLALYYGLPYRLFGHNLYRRIDTTDVTEHALESPADRLTLWQRMSVFDARALLGYYCYRADAFEDAQRVWSKLQPLNLEYRPEIRDMLVEVKHTLALAADETVNLSPAPESGPLAQGGGRPYDPGRTTSTQMPIPPDLRSSRGGSTASPTGGYAPGGESGMERVNPRDTQPPTQGPEARLWNPSTYADWTASGGITIPPLAQVEQVAAPEPAIPAASGASPKAATLAPDYEAGDDESDTLKGRVVPR